ncbi:MAG: NAD-glutamate dehydrogenase [Mariprofundaceae bacterium]
MRSLRHQLIDLLNAARKSQHLPPPAPRLAAILVSDLLALLSLPLSRRTSMRWHCISHEHLHRHIYTIRCPDQAFYLDAVKGYLARRNIQPLEQQTVVFHLGCGPDKKTPAKIMPPDKHSSENHMLIAVHISATMQPEGARLARDLDAVLQAVDHSVRDFPSMQRALAEMVAKLAENAPECAELLHWLNADRYIYFGLQQPQHKRGVFRNRRVLQRIAPGLDRQIAALPAAEHAGIEWLHLPACHHYLYSPASIDLLRINYRQKDNSLNSSLLLGHFSRSARHANASGIPELRQRWQVLLHEPLLAESAFYRREIRTLFDRLPKSLLLAVPVQQCLQALKGFADLTGLVQTHTVLFTPAPGLMHFAVASLPADRFGPNVLKRIGENLNTLGLHLHSYESFGVGSHRIVWLALSGKAAKSSDVAAAIQDAVIFWKDRAKAHVLQHAKQLHVPSVLSRLSTLPPVYQNLFPPEQFIEDIRALDWVRQYRRTRVHVRPDPDGINVQIFTPQALPLGNVVSIVQAFGLIAMREAVVEFKETDATLYLSSIACRHANILSRDAISRLTLALDHVFNDEAENEALNALLLTAALDIQQIAVLATLRNHLVQLLTDAAPLMMTEMLNRHPNVAACLYRMFEARHRPAMPPAYIAQARLEFDKSMESVTSLTDDRWFRALAELVEAGLRTNAFVREAADPVAVKIDPHSLDFVPQPTPYREIFVHGVHVEGVHLRAGPIARGGLRYSDRPADFRTEVLELMATQTVKNGQIVPTGAKGGFVIRNRATPDEAFVRNQYRSFVRSLLQLTDNLHDGRVEPPDGIRIAPEDCDDSYLVVAADKGTARYSDLANDEATAAGFWLDDAFASGGKYGYDHKVLGITARGAWVCAAQHFAALGIDAWTDTISVVGIGDMSGDVFGNGMLLNPQLRLLAAFNHKHIFIDPDPNSDSSFAERRRLFDACLGWDAYDRSIITRGGGVFARTAKKIPIDSQVRQALGIEAEALPGEALIRAILCAPVDMLYNGGIGTYVRASHETDVDVRDPANNSVRVCADALRARVICEGGNLGFTQASRIEYATGGGYINTDAIDNSAGVDMSDHEVNLKILFSPAAANFPVARRNRILRSLSDAITASCLADNLNQSRALSLAEMETAIYPPRIQRLRDVLIAENRISAQTDPAIEDDATLPLRPQLAVLLGHEKNRLHERLADCCFTRQTAFGDTLLGEYFPAVLYRKFATPIASHPLADDIMHTMAANHVVNYFGLGAVYHLETLLEHPTAEIVLGLLCAEYLLDGDSLRDDIWQSGGGKTADVGQICRSQRQLQEWLMRFAEELLRLFAMNQVDQAWLVRQRAAIRRYRKTLVPAAEKTATVQMQLNTLPALAQSAAALHLSTDLNLPLKRCLKATTICLELLPLNAMETQLRTSAWGEEDTAHELRREWLHRLSQLKTTAVRHLLQSKQRNALQTGQNLWQQHRNWDDLQHMREQAQKESMDRMQLLLMLTRCESLIGETASAE